ncbi:isochorismate synthase [Trichothermofontia sp.]
MLVSPQRSQHLQEALRDPQSLYQLLVDCWQANGAAPALQFVSLSIAMPVIAELAALETFRKPDQLHFFCECASRNRAIAAFGAAATVQVSGANRFQRAQAFIDHCLAHTAHLGDLHLPWSGPHFFCRFTFFEAEGAAEYPFPVSTLFLPRWHVAHHGSEGVLVFNLPLAGRPSLWQLAQEVCAQYQHLRTLTPQLSLPYTNSVWVRADHSNRFERSIQTVLTAIQSRQLYKAVLADRLEVQAKYPFQISVCLNRLRTAYPDCYVFATSNGRGDTFLGASPERLLQIQDRQLTTDALAGSAPRGKTAAADASLASTLLQSRKDQYEHQVVVTFIQQTLRQLGIASQLSTPTILQLSNIQHLHTAIQATLPMTLPPLAIVAALHPTPAVAGVPRDLACDEIRRHEPFERGLYAAPLGWVDYRSNSEFFVGIRSALVRHDFAQLYAGAGIVVGSDPQKELAEIQLKFQALLRSLG